jgi:hypothetical protein
MRFGLGIRAACLMAFAGLCGSASFQSNVYAQDRIMGQLQFVHATKVMKASGVWVDGQYVGSLGELRGRNQLRLLPGDHEITVRQAGYSDFTKRVTIEPRMVVDLRVSMERDPRFVYPDRKTSSEVRLDVEPGRAAVFLDDYYIGIVDDYYGVEHGMLVVPGRHRIKIALAGFKTFETELLLQPRQKFELRTTLMGGSINDADSSIRSEGPSAASGVNEAISSPVR